MNIPTRLRIAAGKVHAPSLEKATEKGLYNIGLGFSTDAAVRAYVMDEIEQIRAEAQDADPMSTTPSIIVPQQFTQWWSPEVVETLFTATMSDDILGVTIAGTWADTKVVIPWKESLGRATRYGDMNNVDFVGMNYNYEYRSVVRLQKGILPTVLAEQQAALARIPLRNDLMDSVATVFNIEEDQIAFYGFDPQVASTTEPTYGLLNEVGLKAYESLPNGASGDTTWASKTWQEKAADLRFLVNKLVVQMKGHFNPKKHAFKMVFALSVAQTLDDTTNFGYSLTKYINDTWPNAEIIFAPKFDGADGGENVAYFMLNNIGSKTVAEKLVQQKMFLVGFEQTVYGKKELYSMATAGVMVRYPNAIVRVSGI